jgi:L-gulonate 5-dehydrogenase
MKAAIFDAPHQMHVGHWGNPELGLDDVLVSVKAAGICAGDLYSDRIQSLVRTGGS